MKIIVFVKPNKRKVGVEEIGNGEYVVWTKEPAKENKANYDVIAQLADFFNVSKSSISLIAGGKSRKKAFEISL